MTRTASCCCGACSIQVEGEPTLHALCHCDNCKRRTGSAFGWSAYFPDQQVREMRGSFAEYRIEGDNPQVRSFCTACGTTLFWRWSARPGEVGIAGGAFPPGALPSPAISAREHGRLDWVGLPGDLRRFD
jgi:hypothetical protein